MYLKKVMTALFLASSMAVANAQEETSRGIQLPSWLGNMKLSGYGMVQYQYSGQRGAESNTFNLRIARLSLDGRIAKDFYWKTHKAV